MVPNRFWTLTEFTAAVRLANALAAAPARPLDLVASYGDFDGTTALDASTAWRMILILRSA